MDSAGSLEDNPMRKAIKIFFDSTMFILRFMEGFCSVDFLQKLEISDVL